jgi:hypothetical protein
MGEESFLKGCSRGVLSGSIEFVGNVLMVQNELHPGRGAVGKLVHDLGTSISDSYIENRRFSYRTEIGPVKLDFAGLVPGVDVSYFSALALVGGVALGSRPDWRRTLTNLTPVLSFPRRNINPNKWMAGLALGSVVFHNKEYRKNIKEYCLGVTQCYDWFAPPERVVGHELIHTTQWRELSFLDDSLSIGGVPVGQELMYGLLNAVTVHKNTASYSPSELMARIYE